MAGGKTSHWPGAKQVTPKTRFDIGSVTKVALGLSQVVPLFQSKELELTSSVESVLSSFRGTGYGPLQIGELLNHCAGLVDWIPYFRSSEPMTSFLLAKEKDIVITKPRKTAKYSDIAYWLLRLVLEKVTSGEETELPAVFEWKRTGFSPVKEDVAATEFCLWRDRLCEGEVFDENCFAMGGRALHAGLFSTAEDLSAVAEEWLSALSGRSKWLSAEWAKRLTTPPGWVEGNTYAFGWDTKSPKGSSAGDRFSQKSFGHLGFTGTSLWIDPEAEGYVVFLTNRVHPTRYDTRIRQVRPRIHDLVYEFWESGK